MFGGKKHILLEKTLKAFFVKKKKKKRKEPKYFEHFLTLCPELLHPTTSRAMGILIQACYAVTKALFTKSG